MVQHFQVAFRYIHLILSISVNILKRSVATQGETQGPLIGVSWFPVVGVDPPSCLGRLQDAGFTRKVHLSRCMEEEKMEFSNALNCSIGMRWTSDRPACPILSLGCDVNVVDPSGTPGREPGPSVPRPFNILCLPLPATACHCLPKAHLNLLHDHLRSYPAIDYSTYRGISLNT